MVLTEQEELADMSHSNGEGLRVLLTLPETDEGMSLQVGGPPLVLAPVPVFSRSSVTPSSQDICR